MMKFPYKISEIGLNTLQELSKHDDYLTAYQIGKLGINRKAFTDNVDELIYYDFVKIKQKEFGLQTRKYYKITKLGLQFYARHYYNIVSNKLVEITQKKSK